MPQKLSPRNIATTELVLLSASLMFPEESMSVSSFFHTHFTLGWLLDLSIQSLCCSSWMKGRIGPGPTEVVRGCALLRRI